VFIVCFGKYSKKAPPEIPTRNKQQELTRAGQMALKEKIKTDLKEAMKRGDTAVVSVLRMALSAMQNKEIEKRVENLADAEAERVLATEGRKRKDSIVSFEQGNRPELAQKEREELAVIKAYLPEEASAQEIQKAVKEAIIKTGAQNLKDMGKVMGVAMSVLEGRADGTEVQRITKEELGLSA
ncbi:MAG: GatB/YqeY domain-containing protein, partial [bacterium]|nr:GatB/YqeY domain-containing protein [bacterium]